MGLAPKRRILSDLESGSVQPGPDSLDHLGESLRRPAPCLTAGCALGFVLEKGVMFIGVFFVLCRSSLICAS